MKTEKKVITKDVQIKTLKANPDKAEKHSLGDGLTLEVRPNGKKTFRFRFQWQQKPQTMTLGNYPTLSLADARRLVEEYRIQIESNIDPRKSSESEQTQTTLKEVAEIWKQKNIHRWRPRTQTLHTRSLERDIYPILGNLPIDKIKKPHLLKAIAIHEDKGFHELAHRMHDRLKAIFDFAIASGYTENYPFIGLKKALAPKPKANNQPAVSPKEAHELIDAIQASKASAITKIYVELLAHVFTRPSELRLAEWHEFDLKNAEWHVPAERMKEGEPHWVPLSIQALRLLKQLRKQTGFKIYLFCSPSGNKTQPISETSGRKLLHAAGYKDKHTLHGFRALASTVLHEQSPFRTDAIEAQLAHKVQGVRGVYLRADFKKERRELVEWYSEWLRKNTALKSFETA